jgi:hypothetical protein
MFAATGTHGRTIGRDGGGPGAFPNLDYDGVLGDTVWTVDGTLRRVTLFTLAGRTISTIPYVTLQEGGNPRLRITAVFAGGVATGRHSEAESDVASGKIPLSPLLRVARDGTILDTIALVSTANSALVLRKGGTQVSMHQPHSDTPLVVAAPAANCVFVVDRSVATGARGATFGVTALRLTGDTLWSRRYAYVPTPLESRGAYTINAGRVSVSREEVLAQTFLPDFRTPVTEAIAAADGSLWLRREGGTAELIEYTVIGPSGALVAALTVKRSVTVKAVSGSLVWTVETDEDDVPTVVRSRVSR